MKKSLFPLAAAALVVGAVEILSLAAGSVLYRREFLATREVRRERALGHEDEPWRAPGDAHQERAGRVEVLHPYAGFGLGGTETPAAARDLGFRIPPQALRPERTRDAFVVAVFGGSVAESLGHPRQGAVPLSRRLTSRGPYQGRRVSVIDLAIAGHKQPQQLMTVAYFLVNGARFGAVINLDGFNEVVLPLVENLPTGVPLDYPRGWRSRTQGLDQATRERVAESLGLGLTRRRLAALAERPPLAWSFTMMLLWRRSDEVVARRIAASRAEVLAGLGSPAVRRQIPAPDHVAEAARIWSASSLQLHRLCEANGIRYYHFLQPNLHAGGKPLSTEEIALIEAGDQSYRRAATAGYPLLIAEGPRLRAAGVRFTDLTTLFERHPEQLYSDGCCHLNARGNEMLAEAIADVLIADAATTPAALAPGSE